MQYNILLYRSAEAGNTDAEIILKRSLGLCNIENFTDLDGLLSRLDQGLSKYGERWHPDILMLDSCGEKDVSEEDYNRILVHPSVNNCPIVMLENAEGETSLPDAFRERARAILRPPFSGQHQAQLSQIAADSVMNWDLRQFKE